jgi:hypothetical protein
VLTYNFGVRTWRQHFLPEALVIKYLNTSLHFSQNSRSTAHTQWCQQLELDVTLDVLCSRLKTILVLLINFLIKDVPEHSSTSWPCVQLRNCFWKRTKLIIWIKKEVFVLCNSVPHLLTCKFNSVVPVKKLTKNVKIEGTNI